VVQRPCDQSTSVIASPEELRVAGVLHGVLLFDARQAVGIGEHPAAQLGQPVPQLRLVTAEPFVGVGSGGVDDGAAGQHQHHRGQRAVGVAFGSAAHPRRVVGHHAAHGAGDLAGRVGSQPSAVAGEVGVDGADGGAGLAADPLAAVEHLHVAKALPHVQQDVVADGLAGQAGAAGAQRDVAAVTGCLGEDPGHVAGVAGGDHGAWGEQVVRGVVRHRDPVHQTCADLAHLSPHERETTPTTGQPGLRALGELQQ